VSTPGLVTVADLEAAMESIAPVGLAAEWDNVGLLVGRRDDAVRRVLLTIDLTEPVLEEAIAAEVGCVIAYHPILFRPTKRLADAERVQRIVLRAVRAGMAIHSPHSALDAAPGGINDWLAECLGGGDVRALRPHADLPASEQCKVVTFCPGEAVEQLRNALASHGAGRIGDYELCSFELAGHGTFLGGPGTDPAVGEAGRLERAAETRLEMVCSRAALALAVLAIRQFHPYEEPPIEIHPLEPRPKRDTGEGRRVVLDQPVTMAELAERLKARLGVPQVRVARPANAPQHVEVIGLCAGAGGSLADDAIAQGAEVFLTGEMSHHAVLDAVGRGCTMVLAGHTNTERGYLPTLRERLLERLPGLRIDVAARDADPLEVM